MKPAPVIQLGSATDAESDPDRKIKALWAERLAEQLAVFDLTPKSFQRLLLSEAEVDVSLQTVYAWLSGSWAPSPAKQVAIARLLKVPAHRLFPLEAA